MSLSKVPFIVAGLVGPHITCTPPVPPALENDRRSERVRLSLVTPFVKAIFWILALTEIAAILANSGAAHSLLASQEVLRMLCLTEKNAEKLRVVPQSALGALLSLCGGLIRIPCYRLMGKQFTFDVSILKHHKLITKGPYSVVRHPAYTGALMILGGIILFHTSPGSLFRESGWLNTNLGRFIFGSIAVIMVTPALFFRYRMEIEDAALKSEFGHDWDEWAMRVPYWLVPGVY